ncbi:MAG TPA: zinc-dependent metalloprotease [Chitinophagaceae bacterium]|nr:zinc-dependent metalloprotease [Chitinophagaceae bacterium]
MKNQLALLAVLMLLITATVAVAQPMCGFDTRHQQQMRDDPAYKQSVLESETKIQQYIQEHASQLSRVGAINGVLYKIPVVVHVVHTGGMVGSIYNPSDAQIMGAINYLNDVFSGAYPGTEGVGDIQIQFVLASTDTNCNASTGIERINGSSLTNYAANGVNNSTSGGVSDQALKDFCRWDASGYYNIYVVNKIDGKDGTSGQFVAGYAQFAGGYSHRTDGTIMLATQMAAGQKTLPHEIGHALNLYHTFEGSADNSTCPVNTDCNVNGDKVCDTDPVSNNNVAGVYDFSCRTGTNTCNSAAYSINTEHNIMAYTNCYTLFTAGQKTRMLAAMSLSNRASLVSSWAVPGSTYPSGFTPATAPSCTPVSGTNAMAGNYTGILGVSIANHAVSSDPPFADNGYVNKADKCQSMFPLVKNNTYTISVTLLEQNQEQVKAWIDYNNNGVFEATEQIFAMDNIPFVIQKRELTVSGSFTVPGTVAAGTVVRLRLTNDLGSGYFSYNINNGCYASNYGQTEDYPVMLSAAAALPVSLTSIAASRRASSVVVSWQTAFEQNAKSFEIERSVDGATFTTIGNVAALNSSTGGNYTYTDKNPNAGKLYYRLKQIDFDNRSERSKIVLVDPATNATAARVVQNPFTNQIAFDFGKTQTGNASIQLIDLAGRQVFYKNQEISGQSLITINLSGSVIASGVYILQINTQQGRYMQKVVKQ